MNTPAYFDTITSGDTKFKLEIKEGLSLRNLTEIENRLNIKLPNDLVTFYLHTNGLEGNDWIFNVIPLTDVNKLKDVDGYYLTFAEYMINSEVCGLAIDAFDRNSYRFFKHLMDKENKVKRKYICNSISEFINLYCEQGTFGVFADE